MYSIYKVENIVNGRCFIGCCLTTSLAQNKHRHLSGTGNPRIAADLQFYRREDLDFSVLNEGFECKFEAFRFKEIYVRGFNAFYGGYNATLHVG